MSLRESQNFFFNLMAKPDVIVAFKKDRRKVLKEFFRSEKDREALSKLPFERFETYRKHIQYGILGGLEDAFPVIRSLVTAKQWNDLLNGFYLKRLTRSPIAREAYREFSHYLQKIYRGPLLKRLPYLKELAAYENVDLRLFYGSDRPVPAPLVKDLTAIPSAQNVVTLVPVLNPHHELCEYRWPVHMICRGYASLKRVKQGRYTLLVYRDPETLKVRFFELNPLTADLLKKIQPGRLSIGALIENLAERHRPMDVPSFVTEAMGTLQLLRDKGILLGYRKK